jgi:hypothetical protein
MEALLAARVAEAKRAALDVLLNNARGPFENLPRAAAWGYPEPYTRDVLIAALGYLATGNAELLDALRRTLQRLAENQTPRGHIPSLAHDPTGLGASDTTPLFLLGLALYRNASGEREFLAEAAEKSLTWMEYQSPSDEVMVAQLPTSDWRDEQWVLGFGLYVNTIVYAYLRLFGRDDQAFRLRTAMREYLDSTTDHEEHLGGHVYEERPYFALYAYKIYLSDRFDLLGNSLAILTGITSPRQAQAMIRWIESSTAAMRARGELAVDLPPNLFPFIEPGDDDWMPRYAEYNPPGEYHNGGIWPFICGFYVAAVEAAGLHELAEQKLAALTDLVQPAHDHDVDFGFNEWLRAQDGEACGNDWQTWSAALYLYAAACVEQRRVLFFDAFRTRPLHRAA